MADTTFTNSYITTDALLETAIGADPRAAAIALKALAAASQEWYCQKATEALDKIAFQGLKKTSSQARQFPRKFVLDPEQENPWGETVTLDTYGYYAQAAVPAEVEKACVEEAIALYAFYADTDNTDRQSMRDQGVQSYSLGGVYSESFGAAPDYAGLKSKAAYELIRDWIENAPNII